jgi:hypothetical protein
MIRRRDRAVKKGIAVDDLVNLPKDVDGDCGYGQPSKFVELFPVKIMDDVSTAQCLVQIFSRYGMVRFDRSDQVRSRCKLC